VPVPRFKVREVLKPQGISITIKENYGTHKFIAADWSKKYIETSYKYIVKYYFTFSYKYVI